MKLVKLNSGQIGLFVLLPKGAYAIDIVRSLGVFAPHDVFEWSSERRAKRRLQLVLARQALGSFAVATEEIGKGRHGLS